MVVLDTSSLIRFFTKDDAKKAIAVKSLFEKEKVIIIPEVVFPELEYVLTELYQVERTKIVTVFKFLLSRSNIKLTRQTRIAIKIFEKSKLDFADCLIVVYSLKGKLASFDKELLLITGVKKYWLDS